MSDTQAARQAEAQAVLRRDNERLKAENVRLQSELAALKETIVRMAMDSVNVH